MCVENRLHHRDDFLALAEPGTQSAHRRSKGHSEGVLSVAFSPDGRRIVSGSRDETLKVWDATLSDKK